MNIKKQYPKLFKTLSRLLGARRAINLIRSVKDSPKSDLADCLHVVGAFYWRETKQGVDWWSKVHVNASSRIKGY